MESIQKQEALKTKTAKFVNGYEIKFNEFWGMWQVSHSEIGACIAEFKDEHNAIAYCLNG